MDSFFRWMAEPTKMVRGETLLLSILCFNFALSGFGNLIHSAAKNDPTSFLLSFCAVILWGFASYQVIKKAV